jgi:3',5'-cyclic AMP phosphodiesterase CpdA
MKIIQISDLHVSGSYFVPEWGDLVVDRVNSINPDLLIISGDITDDGHMFEYEKAVEFVSRFKIKNRFMVPGNHDARNEGYKLFEEQFGDRFPVFENDQIFIQGFDSSAPDTDEGHIGRENYKLFAAIKNTSGKLKMIVVHHHVIPIPGTGREENVLSDSGDFLGLIIESGINLVLSGHRHLPWIWRLEETYFITAGAGTTWRLKAHSNASFNIFDIAGDRVRMNQVYIIDNKLEEKTKLDIKIRL